MKHYILRWFTGLCLFFSVVGAPWNIFGQMLRYDEHAEQRVPDYATLRIGPFYSEIIFSQSVGYRYVTTSGTGTNFVFGNNLGEIKEDGSDFPLKTTLGFRNYLIISPDMDLEISFRFRADIYPMDTQEGEFAFELADEGVSAQIGGFAFRMTPEGWFGGYGGDNYNFYASDTGRGMSANIGSEITFTPYVRGRAYDSPSYYVSYVDSRGYTDVQSGIRCETFQNILGFDLDWLMAKDKNLAWSIRRIDTFPQGETNQFDNQRSAILETTLAYEQQVNRDLVAGAQGGLTWRDYPENLRGSQLQSDAELFAKARFTEFTTGDAAVGYSRGTLSDPGSYETEGTANTPTYRLGLRTQLTKKLYHAISLKRRMTAGYSAGIDVIDEVRYSIFWAGEFFDVAASTAWRTVDPRLTEETGYKDWISQLNITIPVTDRLSLYAASAYDQRNNDPWAIGAPHENDPTITADYDTWISSAGFSYLATKRATLNGYVQHMDRTSDDPLLQMTRDTVGINLVYTYIF